MYVAGGTDVIPNMKHGLSEPGHLVALRRIHELGGIRADDGHLRVGAAETLSSVATNPEVVSRFPAVRNFFVAHGIVNSRRAPDEIVTEVHQTHSRMGSASVASKAGVRFQRGEHA